jgi:AbrB family looped-hinge helix DNA binding protein
MIINRAELKKKTKIDKKGRIVIPDEIRDELMLRPKQKLIVESRGSREIILRVKPDSEEFISEMKGCISRSKIKPEELKQIWGVDHLFQKS